MALAACAVQTGGAQPNGAGARTLKNGYPHAHRFKGPAIGLFADQQIRMIDGPLFVGEDYVLRREIVALAESKRTESYWVRTRIYDTSGERQRAEMLLNHATLKHSYPNYDAERTQLS